MKDSVVYGHLWGTPETRELFSDEGRTRIWLDIIKALAGEQAELGLIPAEAARQIAQLELPDLEAVGAQTRATGHSALGLIRVLRDALGPEGGEWVYYGATVQDVSDTWFGLVMRRMLQIARRDLASIEHSLLRLAEEHRDTVMLGRTHGQPGLPITFGFKAAGWADEVQRHIQRVGEAEPRLAVGQLAGAVGTLSAYGEHGPELKRRVLERLGLRVPDTSWLTARDRIAEFTTLLALIAGTLARIGNEVYNLQRPEIGELSEAPTEGVVGSITMPQKRNPERSEHLVTLARVVRAGAGLALEGLVGEHERDGAAWKTEWAFLPEACSAAAVSLALGADLVGGLRVHPERMRANLDAQGGYVDAEQVMLELAQRVGKHRAHELVHRAAQTGLQEGLTFAEALRRHLPPVSEPPPGYLGADARITEGPAPELVAAGYELELADAALLEPGLKLADLAHVLAHPAIPDDQRRAVLDALLQLRIENPDSRYGDIVNVRERELGDAAGWLNAGRPRREAGRIAFRIALRTRLLDLTDAIARFATALTEAAARERDALMPDYTYLQVAQPTTAGHWLLSFAYPAIRDARRTLADFDATNRSPAGAGGVNGSRYAIDRERLAALLGFSGPIEHTRDAMWQTDGFAEAAFHAAQAATSASRFAEDVEIYGSDEFGLLSIGDELCRASALMPQKRNPYALVVIRGGARTLLGRATGVLASQQTPSGRTDNLLYAYGEVAGAVELATRVIALAAKCAETLTIDHERAERRLRESAAMATDAAELLTPELDYRSAYKQIAAGEPPDLDPREAIATRTVTGGAAPAPMDAMLTECRARVAKVRELVGARRSEIEAAEGELLRLARG